MSQVHLIVEVNRQGDGISLTDMASTSDQMPKVEIC